MGSVFVGNKSYFFFRGDPGPIFEVPRFETRALATGASGGGHHRGFESSGGAGCGLATQKAVVRAKNTSWWR